jgi:2-dehydropantoate 2-reductase
MRVLMFGRGTIATIYGWALERAGHEVEFYVRPGRATAYGDAVSLDILDARLRIGGQQVLQEWPVRYRETLEPDHDFDLIMLSVGHHHLAEAADFLAPRVSNATVLVFGNIWSEPLGAVGALPPDRLAWGFPQAGGGFGEDGTLRGALLPSVIFGTLGQPPCRREREVRQVFREAGFKLREQPDFRGWLWIHFAADAGMHSQGLKAGSLSRMIGSPRAFRDAMLTARELLPLVEARGIDLRRHRRSTLLFRTPAALTGAALAWATAHVPLAGSSHRAHTDPDAEEPRAVCRDTLAEAQRLGIAAPRLEAAAPTFAPRGTPVVPLSERHLGRLALSYDVVGATTPAAEQWAPPGGWRADEHTVRLGSGADLWDTASAAVLSWGIKTRSGFTVDPPLEAGHTARQGQRHWLVARFGPVHVREPVEILTIVATPNRAALAYGTLQGHPVSGEEAFIVHRDDDGVVSLTLRSLTSAGRGPWRALFPLILIAQRAYRRRYLRALRLSS